jgi:hypothetical protein
MSTTATAGPTPATDAAPGAARDAAPAAGLTTLSAAARALRDRILSTIPFKVFLWWKLPLAAFAGLRVRRLDPEVCEVTLPAGWWTRNPFGSTYFAAHAMAAEMSMGAMVLMHAANAEPASISTLIGKLTATYSKAAKETVTYRCTEGARLAAAVRKAAETGEAVECEAVTRGTLPDGTVSAEFTIVWSMKRRSGAKK